MLANCAYYACKYVHVSKPFRNVCASMCVSMSTTHASTTCLKSDRKKQVQAHFTFTQAHFNIFVYLYMFHVQIHKYIQT